MDTQSPIPATAADLERIRLARIRAARFVALAVDAAQWVLLPLTMGGAASPVNDALDVFVAGMMIWLVGWHWAFLPTFVAELVPFVDLVPSWSLAVWLATRGAKPGEATGFTTR